MAGFFSMLKALNNCANDLLDVGKEYALKFKNGEITAEEYESAMVGKIYEVTNRYANNDEELEKHLKHHFADAAVDFLKTGIQLYTDSLQTTSENNEQKESLPAQKNTVKDEIKRNRTSKSLNDLNSSSRIVTSSSKYETNKLIKEITKLI